jgi:6-phosphogluconolactonase
MRRQLLIVLLCVISHLTLAPASAEDLLVAVQQPPRVETYSIDGKSGAIKLKSTVELPGAPGPMSITKDKTRLYVAIRIPGEKGKRASSGVATLSRAANGELKVIGSAPLPEFPTYLSIDATGQWLLSAHYGPGQCAVIPVKDGVAQGEFAQVVKTASQAHCIVIEKQNRFAFVPHTNPNKVFQFKIDSKAGKLIPNDPPTVDGPDEDHQYHQPRHIDFHPTLSRAYTANERGGGISVWNYDSKNGTLKLAQTLSSLPPTFNGKSAAADVHVTANGRFVYVSNRDLESDTSKAQDTLAGYSIDPNSGRVKSIGFFRTGHFPRSFAINGSSEFVYAGGQRSNDVSIYRIQTSGALQKIGTQETTQVPIWLMCVK